MKKLKPEIFISKKQEYREGFRYKQFTEYCNGIKLTYDVVRDFEKIFNKPYREVAIESYAYNNTLDDSMFYSHFWKDENAKEKAFEKIYDFNIKGKSGTGSSTTPLFPFEIYLMNDGFEMGSFSELTALNPGTSLICDKYEGDKVYGPIGILYTRWYQKKDLMIYIGFGIRIGGVQTNFYFGSNQSNSVFQIDNNIENYNKAINLELKDLLDEGCIQSNHSRK